ncbi:arsenic resistance protein [uncultured Corynebacterium sp.]|uniref:arsenic resistance protein n=1 Tax=uncultured Corynebacterium sp. TaxID=159447 RepID=UPI0025DEAB6C|nr:arsenic resistance protein [uncultured Corynebacterium sp.]
MTDQEPTDSDLPGTTPNTPAPGPDPSAAAPDPGWWERHQIPLYFAAIVAGAGVGLVAKHLGASDLPAVMGWLVTPTLGLLLFATFLSVPVVHIGRAFHDVRFAGTIAGVNFLLVPWVAFGLSRFVTDDRALLMGLLLVLLTPCIDYVIAFTGLAGGARVRLLAATPMLLLLQMAFLPVYLLMFVGPGNFFAGDALVSFLDPGPFLSAFAFLIVLPLAGAAVVQAIRVRSETLDDDTVPEPAASRIAGGVERVMAAAMVPLMMATLALVIGSQINDVGAEIDRLARLVPLYAVFLPIAVALGVASAKLARLDVPAVRAVGFSAGTRNSLVVLPLALALPEGFEIAALAVVTQTMVELVGMVILVKVMPRLVSEPATAR